MLARALCPRHSRPVNLTLACRTFTTASTKPTEWSDEAHEAAAGLSQRWARTDGQPCLHLHQTLDSNQVHLLRILTGEMVRIDPDPQSVWDGERTPTLGDPLVPGEHLVFFTPRGGQAHLGHDGSDTTFNPPGGVFTRRMWAGGEMHFDPLNPLCIGQHVHESTWIDSVDLKRVRSLPGLEGEMILVGVRKELANDQGVSVRERRSWIFRRAPPPTTTTTSSTWTNVDLVTKASVQPQRAEDIRLHLSVPQLLRYSALTYNAHRIHYDREWCRLREGVPEPVVHGPLNVSLLLRMAWTHHQRISSVAYRATRPVVAGQMYFLRRDDGEDGTDDRTSFRAIGADGQVLMTARMKC